jgi:hypothetical protein
MKRIVLIFLFCFLTACAGPVQVANNEKEGLKAGYQDPVLAALSRKYADLLKSIYTRYRLNKTSLAKEGLGDFFSILDGSETVSSVLANSEVITSLDLAPPRSIKLKYD